MTLPKKRTHKIPNPRMLEIGNISITPDQSKTVADHKATILDRNWIKQAFLLDDNSLNDPDDIKNRYWSSASAKFTDTRLGGNIGINARPQFTWYSDIRNKGRLKGRNPVSVQNIGGNYGMGRYYSEAIDDNSQTIYLRFGVPQFNSLTDFLTKAFNGEMTAFARTGRGPSAWFQGGQIVGTALRVVAVPALSMTLIAGRLINTFFGRQTSKFYTMKPTMMAYWMAVNSLVNMLLINRGIMPRSLQPETQDQNTGNPYIVDQGYLDVLHNLMPDVFNNENGFDILAVANRAQRIANQAYTDEYQQLNQGSATDWAGYVHKTYQDEVNRPEDIKLSSWINEHVKFGYYVAEDSVTSVEVDPKVDPDTGQILTADTQGFGNFFDAEFRGGSQFAVFKVDHTGPVSESFSSATVESDLSNKFNTTSSQARETRFSLAEGNLVGGALGEAIQGAVGDVKDVVAGVASGMTAGVFDGLAGLAGSGFIDIPKHWQSSSCSLPRSTYTIQLISPYGNAISQMQNIYIPLAMLLAGTLPLSTGSQSYTSPFLCQIYDRGRCQVQLGMIESLSITRGTCNLPFTNRGYVQAIDVTFTVADMSTIMHMPISASSAFGGIGSSLAASAVGSIAGSVAGAVAGAVVDAATTGNRSPLDGDNILNDYLAVLAGQDMYTQIYPLPRAKLKFAKMVSSVSELTSPAYLASVIHEDMTSGLLKYTMFGTILEGLASGSNVITRN